jgi:hypothetical protein
MAFKYRIRSSEAWEKRTHQSSGDYEGYLTDAARLFTPSRGDNHIRIMPPSSHWDADHYGLDIYVHWSVGPSKATVLCNWKMGTGDCPLCQQRARLERAHDEDGAKELRPTKRVLTLVINRKSEGEGVLVWPMPYTVDQQISLRARDRTTGTWFFVDDPEKGYDLYIDKTGENLNTKYDVSIANRPSPVAPKHLDWVENHPIPELLRHRTYEEVKNLYEGRGRGEAEDDDEERDGGPSGYARRDRRTGEERAEDVRPPRERRPNTRSERQERQEMSERNYEEARRQNQEDVRGRDTDDDDEEEAPFETRNEARDEPETRQAAADDGDPMEMARRLQDKFKKNKGK